MGIFDSIKNKAIGFLDTVSGIVTNPITAITQGTSASTQKFLQATPLQNTAKTIVNTGIAGGLVVGAGAAAEAGITKTTQVILGQIIKHPVATTGTLIAVPAIISSHKLQQTVEDLPAKGVSLGTDTGKFIDNPTVAGAKQIIEDHPVVSSVVAGAIALEVGKTVGSLIGSYQNYSNTKAVKDNTEATRETLQGNNTVASSPPAPQVIQIQQIPSSLPVAAEGSPPLPVSKPKKKTKKKPKKKRKSSHKKKKRK